jgi:hypothetical protein
MEEKRLLIIRKTGPCTFTTEMYSEWRHEISTKPYPPQIERVNLLHQWANQLVAHMSSLFAP